MLIIAVCRNYCCINLFKLMLRLAVAFRLVIVGVAAVLPPKESVRSKPQKCVLFLIAQKTNSCLLHLW